MLRRTVLRLLFLSGLIAPFSRAAAARLLASHAVEFGSLAETVLPTELGAEGRAKALESFFGWLRDYRPGAQMDHGYGVTRLWQAGPSPAARYVAQFADLHRRTRTGFALASLEDRRTAVIAAIEAAGVRELPERPDGGHVATDLMAHYFNGPEANDLAYRRQIGRFGCRGLEGSEQTPSPLPAAEHAS